jgi:hypothetical protein
MRKCSGKCNGFVVNKLKRKNVLMLKIKWWFEEENEECGGNGKFAEAFKGEE